MNYIETYCSINSEGAMLNGEKYFEPSQNALDMRDFFSELYNLMKLDYRKFFKMDALSKLGFLSAELLLEGFEKEQPKEDMGVLLFNRSASLEADERYKKTICDDDNFFPSPAEFVYTLPNIVTGEIAIRNKIYGETMFYVLPDFQPETICNIINDTISSANLKYAIGGWVEVHSGKFDARTVLCSANENKSKALFTSENLKNLFCNI